MNSIKTDILSLLDRWTKKETYRKRDSIRIVIEQKYHHYNQHL